jgi:NAD(P)H-hydrate epimerase
MLVKTVAQLQEIDIRCEQDYGIQALILMEHAGKGAASVATSMNRLRRMTLVVAGWGNNGGDGFVLARHLHNAKYPVRVCLIGSALRMAKNSPARINFEILKRLSVPVVQILDAQSLDMLEKEIKRAGLLVDALLGTGLKGEVRPPLAAVIEIINKAGLPVLSLDVPSGLDADTGIPLGSAVRATQTATFVVTKAGFLKSEVRQYTGKVTVIDIGVPPELLAEV